MRRTGAGPGGGDQKGSLVSFIGGLTSSLSDSAVVGNEAVGGAGGPGVRGGNALGSGKVSAEGLARAMEAVRAQGFGHEEEG